MPVILSIIIFVSGSAALFGKSLSNKTLFFIFKPLTTILILCSAILFGSELTCTYKYYIYSALIFCLAGDIFLMLKSRFVYGLLSFFIAHIIFSAGFILIRFTFSLWLFIIFFIIGILLFIYLSPDLSKYKLPVLFYIPAILFMSWRAYELYPDTILIPAASLLFLISDFALAIRNFKKTFPYVEPLILTTYYLAIFLLAHSMPSVCRDI